MAWKSNSEADLAGYKVYYSTISGQYSASRDVGTPNTYVLDKLTNGQKYYVAVVAYDKSYSKNESPLSVQIAVTPRDGQPPAKPAAFRAIPTANNGILNWVNPGDLDFQGVVLVKKQGAFPLNINDGQTLYTGTAENFDDTSVAQGVEYFYSLFAFDEIPFYSEAATKSVLVLP